MFTLPMLIRVCNLSEKFFSDPNLVPLHVIRSFSIMYPILVGVKFNPTFNTVFRDFYSHGALSLKPNSVFEEHVTIIQSAENKHTRSQRGQTKRKKVNIEHQWDHQSNLVICANYIKRDAKEKL